MRTIIQRSGTAPDSLDQALLGQGAKPVVKASLGLVEGGREVSCAYSMVVPLAGSVLGAALPEAAEDQLVDCGAILAWRMHSLARCSLTQCQASSDPGDLGLIAHGSITEAAPQAMLTRYPQCSVPLVMARALCMGLRLAVHRLETAR